MYALRRCTGCPGLLLLSFLLSFSVSAQSPEALLAEGNYPAAAEAFTTRGSRADLFAAGEAWLAVDSLARARSAFRRVADAEADSLGGLAWHKIGLTHYYAFDDAGAAAAYRRAIGVRDAVFPGRHLDRAKSRGNLAGTLIFLGQTDSAGLLLREAIDMYANLQPTDTTNWLRSLANLMQVSIELRDYQVGVSAANSAIDLLRHAAAVKARDRRSVHYRAASTYFHFGELPAARASARRLQELARTDADPADQVQALNLLAGIADKEGRNDDFIRLSEEALRLSREYDLDRGSRAFFHFNLAQGYGEAGDLDRALANVAIAREIYAESAPAQLPAVASIRGDLERKAGRPAAARAAFDRGLRLLGGEPETATAADLYYPRPDSLDGYQLEIAANLLGDRAAVLAELGQPAAALRDYDLLFTIQDLLRGRVSSDASRRYLSQNLRPFFDRAIDLHVARYAEGRNQDDLWQAFWLSERAKAYSLLTALQRNRNTMPQREAELRRRIAALERQASTTPGRTAALEAARLQLDRFLQLTDEPLSTPELRADRQGLLDLLSRRGTNLLAFHLGRTAGHVFFLEAGTGTLRHGRIGQPAALAPATEKFRAAIVSSAYRRKSLRDPAEQRGRDAEFLEHGHGLYAKLFPAGDALSDPAIREEDLLVIPDGALNFLPFGCLPLATAAAPLDYGELPYFQGDRQLTYAYSTTFLLELDRRGPVDYAHNLLAFAPSFRGAAPVGQLTRAATAERGERAFPGLSPLKHNTEEVTAIARLVAGTRAFLGAEADRTNFLREAGNGRIVHLSTHGMVNAAEPHLSFVAFSQLGDSLELEELLYFNDLSALPLPTELAVLSACETNLGAYVPGETTLSLASAFAAAGARSTLTTLWQVDDAATKDLMINFYQALAAGASRGEALLSAQSAHREGADYAHPYYWGALTLYGDAGPLPLATTPGRAILLAVTGLFVLVLLGGGYLLWRSRAR